MGFILASICLTVLVTLIAAWLYDWDKDVAKGWFVGMSCFGLVLCCVIWSTSYISYLDTRTFYDATREQYANSVKMYHDYALLDIKGASAVAFTDLKYEEYQKNMASFIENLRRRVVEYNEEIISKRLMKRTFFFNWMIFVPDEDMKVIKMTSKAAGAAEGL